jgi:hypothetical protein
VGILLPERVFDGAGEKGVPYGRFLGRTRKGNPVWESPFLTMEHRKEGI